MPNNKKTSSSKVQILGVVSDQNTEEQYQLRTRTGDVTSNGGEAFAICMSN